jgi:hypothetical protein
MKNRTHLSSYLPLVGRSESEAIRVGGGARHGDRSPTRKMRCIFRPPHKGEVSDITDTITGGTKQ